MKLFLDADSILFKAACTGKEKGTEDSFFDGIHEVKNRVREVVEGSISDCFADELYVAIKGKNNFRYKIFPDYKGNRTRELSDNLRRRLNEAYFYIKKKYNAIPSDGMEADDLVCIWAHEAREAEEQFIIGHIDKDINQIAGNHYNYNNKEIYFVDDYTAHMNFCKQLLTGDSGDNIPKLKKGLGPKTAENILHGSTYEELIPRVYQEYKRVLGTGYKERLNLIGNLIWMKRTMSEELEWNYYEYIKENRNKRKANDSKSNERIESSED